MCVVDLPALFARVRAAHPTPTHPPTHPRSHLPGASTITPGSDTLALLAPAVMGAKQQPQNGQEEEEADGFDFDPNHFDTEGRQLWFGELQVEMDPGELSIKFPSGSDR